MTSKLLNRKMRKMRLCHPLGPYVVVVVEGVEAGVIIAKGLVEITRREGLMSLLNRRWPEGQVK